MNELLLIKDKVTEEHKLVDEWTGLQVNKVFEKTEYHKNKIY